MPPSRVVTSESVGDLQFENASPTDATVDELFDQLDFQRGCQTLLLNITASSMYSFREGLRRDLGVSQQVNSWCGKTSSTPGRCCSLRIRNRLGGVQRSSWRFAEISLEQDVRAVDVSG